MSAMNVYGDEPAWRKSTHSISNGQCVEIGTVAGVVAFRDSNDPDGCELHCSAAAWRCFISQAKAGEMPQLLRL